MAGQLTIDSLKASSGVLATQNGMTGIAKAWARFDSTGAITGGAGVGSFNVSSITVNAGGDFTMNFTTAMPSANYTVSGVCGISSSGNYVWGICPRADMTSPVPFTTAGFRFNTKAANTTDPDIGAPYICVSVFSS